MYIHVKMLLLVMKYLYEIPLTHFLRNAKGRHFLNKLIFLCMYLHVYVSSRVMSYLHAIPVTLILKNANDRQFLNTLIFLRMYIHLNMSQLVMSYLQRGGGLGSRPKKMYGERLGDGVEYHLMSPTPRR